MNDLHTECDRLVKRTQPLIREVQKKMDPQYQEEVLNDTAIDCFADVLNSIFRICFCDKQIAQ